MNKKKEEEDNINENVCMDVHILNQIKYVINILKKSMSSDNNKRKM